MKTIYAFSSAKLTEEKEREKDITLSQGERMFLCVSSELKITY
jgi:hypothetical protein